MDLPPPTRYARRGDLSIAYQMFGLGSRTVVSVLGVGSGIEFRGRGSHDLKGVPGTWELFSVADRQSEPVSVTGERRHLKIGDRIVLTAARRAPDLVRAAARLDERSRRHRELKRLT